MKLGFSYYTIVQHYIRSSEEWVLNPFNPGAIMVSFLAETAAVFRYNYVLLIVFTIILASLIRA